MAAAQGNRQISDWEFEEDETFAWVRPRNVLAVASIHAATLDNRSLDPYSCLYVPCIVQAAQDMAEKNKAGNPRVGNRQYSAIAQKISQRLIAKEWDVGSRLPSYRDFAHEYGVSLGTIQKAFQVMRGEGLVDIRPQRSITAAFGVSLSSLMDGAIAIVFPRFGGAYSDLLTGILARCHRTNLAVILLSHGHWNAKFPAGLSNLPLKGILVCGPLIPRLLRQYARMKVPVVLLDQPGEKYLLHSVAVANFDAAFHATRKLIQLGHRRIAFLRYVVPSLRDIDPDSKERQAGFLAACREAQLPEADSVTFTASNYSGGTRVEVAQILRTTPRFTAFVASSETQASQVEAEARSLHLKIPQDISVAAFRSPGPLPIDWSGPVIDTGNFAEVALDLLAQRPASPQHVRVPANWHGGATVARVTR